MTTDNSDFTRRIADLSPTKRALLESRLRDRGLESLALHSISRRVERESAPLSFAQQRLWFLNQLEPQSPAYNECSVLQLTGALDVEALEKAINCIVRRHEVLRTTFHTVDGNPMQRIEKYRQIALPLIDLRTYPSELREAEAHRRMGEAIQQPFDLSGDLMLRPLLLRLADELHILLMVKHHIASDGWSSSVFRRELSVSYEAFSEGAIPNLPDLPIQYADYAVWQREWLQGENLQSQLSYWRNQLAGVPTLNLPTDRPRPAAPSFRGAKHSFTLSAELSDRLKTVSRQEGVTLFMTLLAAFQILLYRYTGQEDIPVGTPIAGRTRPETESLIGFFVNTLVLRTDLSGNPSFREILARVRKVALEAYNHQDLPFEKLVEDLNPDRTLSQTPLFQALFAFQNMPRESAKMSGLDVTAVDLDKHIAKFDLYMRMWDETSGLQGAFEYSSDIYNDSTIARVARGFEVLLEGIVADPDLRLVDLPILPHSERQKLLSEWNDTKKNFPKLKCLHQVFEAQAEKTPDAVAVKFENQQLAYRELNARANRLARYLQQLGVGPDVLVGLCVERSLELVIGILGILKAGGAYLPLDPGYPRERLAFMLQDSGVQVLLTQERLLDRLPHDGAQTICLDRDWQLISQELDSNPDIPASSENLAYVIYTSGSTGQPKGVTVRHRGVIRLLFGVDYVTLDRNQTILQLAPLSFDASTFEIWGALLHGATCVLHPGSVPTPKQLAAFIHEHNINTLWLTAALYNSVVDEAPEALADIKQLLIGGEALSVAHVKLGLDLLPNTQIINGYGPTEGTTFTCCYPIPRDLFNQPVTSIPIGRPIGNTQVYILDPHLNPVPIGVSGELYIGGDGLARGYLNRRELTAEKFINNPFSDEIDSRLYRTGDLARYLTDGNIEFLGRIDDQVKIRGFRIEPGEIEVTLAQHPSVRDSVVVAREDSPGDRRLVVYVVSQQRTSLTTQELRSFLKDKLPDYMVPSAFVILDALPLTPNGKIDRKALPAPDQNRSEFEQSYVAPRTPVEELLAEIWAEVLKVERVGIHDNFFDLGGHSLKATQVMSRLRDAIQVDLSLRFLFESPTVEGLARMVEEKQSTSSTAGP
jgi:amino acid adenylation domain-containing protein